MRYIAFDVETPNWANDRMSSIGVAVVEDGKIVERFSSLIQPETHFDSFNVALTGITPQMVADAPTFAQLWPLLRPLLESGTPVFLSTFFTLMPPGCTLPSMSVFFFRTFVNDRWSAFFPLRE